MKTVRVTEKTAPEAIRNVGDEVVPTVVQEVHKGVHLALREETADLVAPASVTGTLLGSIGSVVGRRSGVEYGDPGGALQSLKSGGKSAVVVTAPHAMIILHPFRVEGEGAKRGGNVRNPGRKIYSERIPDGVRPAIDAVEARLNEIWAHAERQGEEAA